MEALSLVHGAPDIAAAARKKLQGVEALFGRLTAEASHAGPSALLKKVLEETGYSEMLRQENSPESDARLENLQEFYGSLVDFEVEMASAGEPATLETYLERVSLQADVDGVKDASRVTLMTVHGAKGLEFQVVCLTGMEEEMFPYKGMDPGGDEEMEEERRLAYVAITRARERLVITHTSTRQIFGTTRWGRPSRFVSDIPAKLLEGKATRAAAGRSLPSMDRGAPWRSPSSSPPMAAGHPMAPAGGPWRSGSSRPPAPAEPGEPGERYVDRSYFEDDAGGEATPLRRGSRVRHARFGEGEVRSVEGGSNPAVVAFFPGWGEKKILVQFLQPA
jgi:DNA helicase-2/ATP-dependent DNA helicase PcrA